ncbi:hypothetical protein PCANC_25730 [Puccinia coronata f. sp. avenae]|uniref:Uncharacterized protein n=1 Tax=Puccinia coronata f. sp. avenae TaxID=200324 RepID=A0A2N5U7J6_9BASI|nr:hypothetical protein PCANC_25730 [Puccinia coronata f. sp. avenae]
MLKRGRMSSSTPSFRVNQQIKFAIIISPPPSYGLPSINCLGGGGQQPAGSLTSTSGQGIGDYFSGSPTQSQSSATPAYKGYIGSTHDALIIFSSCYLGRFPMVLHWLHKRESSSTSPSSVTNSSASLRPASTLPALPSSTSSNPTQAIRSSHPPTRPSQHSSEGVQPNTAISQPGSPGSSRGSPNGTSPTSSHLGLTAPPPGARRCARALHPRPRRAPFLKKPEGRAPPQKVLPGWGYPVGGVNLTGESPVNRGPKLGYCAGARTHRASHWRAPGGASSGIAALTRDIASSKPEAGRPGVRISTQNRANRGGLQLNENKNGALHWAQIGSTHVMEKQEGGGG